jgi:hypothetical protein
VAIGAYIFCVVVAALLLGDRDVVVGTAYTHARMLESWMSIEEYLRWLFVHPWNQGSRGRMKSGLWACVTSIFMYQYITLQYIALLHYTSFTLVSSYSTERCTSSYVAIVKHKDIGRGILLPVSPGTYHTHKQLSML